MDSDPQVAVLRAGYFPKLSALLQGTSARLIVNYVLKKYVDGFDDALDERFDEPSKVRDLLTSTTISSRSKLRLRALRQLEIEKMKTELPFKN